MINKLRLISPPNPAYFATVHNKACYGAYGLAYAPFFVDCSYHLFSHNF